MQCSHVAVDAAQFGVLSRLSSDFNHLGRQMLPLDNSIFFCKSSRHFYALRTGDGYQRPRYGVAPSLLYCNVLAIDDLTGLLGQE